MSIKSILCLSSGAYSETNAIDFAMGVTKLYAAQLRVLHVGLPLVLYPDPIGLAGITYGATGPGSSIMDTLVADDKALMEAAKKAVETSALAHKVAMASEEESSNPLKGARVIFKPVVGFVRDMLPPEGRVSDFIVIANTLQPGPDPQGLSAAVFTTGRPVFLIPAGRMRPVEERVWGDVAAIAWDGSAFAARAVFDALPFLRNFRKIYLFSVQEHGQLPDQYMETGILAYLHMQDLPVSVLRVSHTGHSVGETILQRAGALDVSLLVMGAYGSGHLREKLFGGVSQYIVDHATMPVFLSH